MSYEGYDIYLCKNGHQIVDNDPYNYYPVYTKICPICEAKYQYYAAVDETNGRIEKDPSTYPPPVEEIGFTDSWHTDHYGNRYAIKRKIYKPAPNSRWKAV